ncbi:MAG: M15 family metallopeptidase [Dehalococcoidia bacterium]|jgi:D-alanyl-D-alanine carboxypeptidase
MSTSRPSRRASTSKRSGVVGKETGGKVPLLFIGAVVAVIFAFIVLITVAADAFSGGNDGQQGIPASTDTATATQAANTAVPATTVAGAAPTATPGTTDPVDGSILLPCGNILVPLDKQHKLASDCAPSDLVTVAGGTQLRSEAAGAFNEMLAAASKAGFSLYANSAYRSYSEQVATFQYWVNTSGLAYAERTSARAGHSEHQLGTTADVGANGKELEAFEGTPEAAWVAANSYKYGFIVSYPDGKESITGYAPEPWHIRYVGKDVAQKVRDSGLTLHEYLLK